MSIVTSSQVWNKLGLIWKVRLILLFLCRMSKCFARSIKMKYEIKDNNKLWLIAVTKNH